jgi:23S rRNA pseudouridine1911/1915/1917 synthase
MPPKQTMNVLHARIPADAAGKRLDRVLAELFPDYSRSRLKRWIEEGCVRIDERQPRPRDIVHGGEAVMITPVTEEEVSNKPQAIPINIVYEDDDIIVINKQAGQVVHPAAGHRDGTLLNAILHHAPELAEVPRAGIVHRLDKDTSGLLVVARNLKSQKRLVEQLQARSIERYYQAIVTGTVIAGGTVDQPIGRHPVQRQKMAVRERGRQAVSHYRVLERFRAHTLLGIKLETGRTHQIRVHMAWLKHPIVGDPQYGGRPRLPPDSSEALINALQAFRRQALHASRLVLLHPQSSREMRWEAPLPDDMLHLIDVLRQDAGTHPHTGSIDSDC